jgi:predicted MPP superfamily phosphohydrolase
MDMLSMIWPARLFALVIIAVYIVEVYRIILYFLRRRHRQANRLLTGPYMIVIHSVAIAGIACACYGYLIEPYNLQINTIRIETDKLKNTSLRIVQISDLHCDKKARLEPLLADFINPLKPDIILFTGDAVNSAAGLELFHTTMAGLHASIGKFAVKGNWETIRLPDLDCYKTTGFDVLEQDVRFLEKDGQTFCIAGLSYLEGPNSWPVVSRLRPDCFTLFLFHTPDFVYWLKDLPIDLYLCGHTHGGQIALPFVGSVIHPKIGGSYVQGLHDYEHIPVYTNRGIGMTGYGPRIRFLSRPEIAVFEIVPKTAPKPVVSYTSPERQ